jgi:hypothetical protein
VQRRYPIVPDKSSPDGVGGVLDLKQRMGKRVVGSGGDLADVHRPSLADRSAAVHKVIVDGCAGRGWASSRRPRRGTLLALTMTYA